MLSAHKKGFLSLLLLAFPYSSEAQYINELNVEEPFQSGLTGYNHSLETAAILFENSPPVAGSGFAQVTNARSILAANGDGIIITAHSDALETDFTEVNIDVGLEGFATSSLLTSVSDVTFHIHDIDSGETGNTEGTDVFTIKFQLSFENNTAANSLDDISVTASNASLLLSYASGSYTCDVSSITGAGASLTISSNILGKRLKEIHYQAIRPAYAGDAVKFRTTRTLDRATPVSNTFFTIPATDLSENLSEDGIYPDGIRLGFGIYSISETTIMPSYSITNLERVADAGFTLNGPHYRDDASSSRINTTTALDMSYTYQIIPASELFPDNVPIAVSERAAVLEGLTDSEIIQGVRDAMDTILNDPLKNAAVARWTLEPEELRHWVEQDLRLLTLVSNEVQSYDPLGRPFSMYEPNHRTQNDLEQTGAYQDMVTMGVYVTDSPDAERGAQLASGVDRIVNAALTLSSTPQVVFQLSSDFADDTTDDEILRKIRHDVLLSFTRGIKSAVIWSGFHSRSGLTNYDTQLDAYCSVVADLTENNELSNAFLFGETRTDLTMTQLSGDTEVSYIDSSSDANSKTIDALTLYNTQYGSSRYLVVINSAPTSASCLIEGLPETVPYTMYDMLDDIALSTETHDGSLPLTLLPYEAKVYSLTSSITTDSYSTWASKQGDASASYLENTLTGNTPNAIAWAFNFDLENTNTPSPFNYNSQSGIYTLELPSEGSQSAIFLQQSSDLESWDLLLEGPIPLGSSGSIDFPNTSDEQTLFYRALILEPTD